MTSLCLIILLLIGLTKSFRLESTIRGHKHVLAMNKATLDVIGKEISRSLGSAYTPVRWKDSYGSGGSGASSSTIIDEAGLEFFVKKGDLGAYNMLKAEYCGVKAISDTCTIRVPKPICIGTADYDAFVVFEKLNIGGYGKAELLAERLAALHRCHCPAHMFGWEMNNTIGATFQSNPWTPSWADFWDRNRLGHMLALCKGDGATFPMEKQLREKVRLILEAHYCEPSLVHGDLWSGNQGFTSAGEPVIFDPAVYYGDREVDIAMTKLFGANSRAFYETYDKIYPRPPGYEVRETVYNLYHILNHFVLFGGGYLSQAYSMIDRIIKA